MAPGDVREPIVMSRTMPPDPPKPNPKPKPRIAPAGRVLVASAAR
jgi:hypothetical protein